MENKKERKGGQEGRGGEGKGTKAAEDSKGKERREGEKWENRTEGKEGRKEREGRDGSINTPRPRTTGVYQVHS